MLCLVTSDLLASNVNHASREEKLHRFNKHVSNLYHESEVEGLTENESLLSFVAIKQPRVITVASDRVT